MGKPHFLVSNFTAFSWVCPLTCESILANSNGGYFLWAKTKDVVKFLSHVWLCWPHGLQHARLPCPSLPPGVLPSSFPLSRWCQPTISSSVVLFSFCLQSFSASASFPISWLSTSGGQSIEALRITALSWQRGLPSSVKLWAMPCRARWEGHIIVESSGKMWSTGRGNGKPLQYSCHESPMDSVKRQRRQRGKNHFRWLPVSLRIDHPKSQWLISRSCCQLSWTGHSALPFGGTAPGTQAVAWAAGGRKRAEWAPWDLLLGVSRHGSLAKASLMATLEGSGQGDTVLSLAGGGSHEEMFDTVNNNMTTKSITMHVIWSLETKIEFGVKIIFIKKWQSLWDFQWLRICLAIQTKWVWSLLGGLRSHIFVGCTAQLEKPMSHKEELMCQNQDPEQQNSWVSSEKAKYYIEGRKWEAKPAPFCVPRCYSPRLISPQSRDMLTLGTLTCFLGWSFPWLFIMAKWLKQEAQKIVLGGY